VEIQVENKMKNVVLTAMLISSISTSAMAWDTEKRYDMTTVTEISPDDILVLPSEKVYEIILPQPSAGLVCSNTDITIGVVAGVVTGVVVGLASVSGMTLVGPGVVAGSKLGLSAALSAPFLAKTTIPLTAMSLSVFGPAGAVVGHYASCVVRSVW
jgi:hypothetical protein